MLDARDVVETLRRNGITFFTGVPDSLLKDLCACVAASSSRKTHVIAANEGAAVALAAGHHLATGELAAVYLQNSGLGNAVNPLLSLADPDVYSLPMVLIVGWRGEPSVHDEPQHIKQGRVMLAMLDAMELPYRVLSAGAEAAADIAWAADLARQGSRPVALIVRKGSFAFFGSVSPLHPEGSLVSREAAIETIVGALDPDDAVVATTGMISRELYEIRMRRGEGSRDFLTVGSMGHASAIATAVARSRPERQVFCLDGDGAFLMHMGSIAVQGESAATNFKHVVLNNGCHDSVGGQPTAALHADLTGIASACGYRTLPRVTTLAQITQAVTLLRQTDGPVLLEIRVRSGARSDLARPSSTPVENKDAFTRFLASRNADE